LLLMFLILLLLGLLLWLEGLLRHLRWHRNTKEAFVVERLVDVVGVWVVCHCCLRLSFVRRVEDIGKRGCGFAAAENSVGWPWRKIKGIYYDDGRGWRRL
jgi:hypothetical protein